MTVKTNGDTTTTPTITDVVDLTILGGTAAGDIAGLNLDVNDTKNNSNRIGYKYGDFSYR